MIIQPLTTETLEPAISLAEKSFPLDFSIDPNRIRGSIEIAISPTNILIDLEEC